MKEGLMSTVEYDKLITMVNGGRYLSVGVWEPLAIVSKARYDSCSTITLLPCVLFSL